MHMVGMKRWVSSMDYIAWFRNIILDAWEIRKHKLYGSDSGPGQQLHFKSSLGDLAVVEGHLH